MIASIASQGGFLLLLSFFAAGALGALAFRKNDALANFWSSAFAVGGSLWGIIFALSIFISGTTLSFHIAAALSPFLSISFAVGALSAFFIFIISLVALFASIYGIGYVKHYYKKYTIGTLGFFYHFFIAGMLMVVTASNAILFLIVWEIMSLASYFLVIYDRNDPKNIKAGSLYFIMTHIGTAFIMLAFLLLYRYTGSFDFGVIKANSAAIPMFAKNMIFIFSFIGFGMKAGIIPLHIWLPDAHPAAPSHVSALMSGVMIKTGIFMMIKLFFDVFTTAPLWWGVAILVIGSVSALLGVLYALTEHDIKRLLAYHSIENIGIILLGIGSALVFSSLGMPALAALGMIAALFHTLNHAVFKSLLFLSAGSVIEGTRTRNIEEYGGLMKRMPETAFFFLIGSMAIAALPPFNGFFSEWLTFQSLFAGIYSFSSLVVWIFILSAGTLALTSGLALACFVKAFGATFLARPRSHEAACAKESGFSLQFGMAGLALLSLVFGLFSGSIVSILNAVVKNISGLRDAASIVAVHPAQTIAVNGFASVSAPALFAIIILALALSVVAIKYLVNRKQNIKTGATWDCGTDLTPRMEITATGFSRSIIMIFQGILKPSFQTDIEYNDASMRYVPKSRTATMHLADFYRVRFYDPIRFGFMKISGYVKKIQSGNINAYILYMLIVLLAALLSASLF